MGAVSLLACAQGAAPHRVLPLPEVASELQEEELGRKSSGVHLSCLTMCSISHPLFLDIGGLCTAAAMQFVTGLCPEPHLSVYMPQI